MRGNRAISSVFAAVGGASAAFACCVAYGRHPVSLVDEKAIIVWNPDQHTEHFIRQASFKGDAKDFGFIVPAPNKPEVATADARAFGRLQNIAFPPMRAAGKGALGGGGFGAPQGEVQVIEQYRVGDYLATILRGSDGQAINAWLKQNGYTSRPAMTPWLDYYAQRKWYFAALKFIRESDQTSPATSALRISFQTDVPFYPYKMPADTWPKGYRRPLALYFIAPAPVRAEYREAGVAWEAKVAFTGKLPEKALAPLAKELGMRVDEFPDDARMTAFLNQDNVNGYGRDLEFWSPRKREEGSSASPAVYVLAVSAVAALAIRARRRA